MEGEIEIRTGDSYTVYGSLSVVDNSKVGAPCVTAKTYWFKIDKQEVASSYFNPVDTGLERIVSKLKMPILLAIKEYENGKT